MRTITARTVALAAGLVSAVLLAAPAAAERIDMSVFENDDDVDVSGLDLWIDVLQNGASVDFVFHNTSTTTSVITSIYFEDTAFSSAYLSGGRIVTPQPSGVNFRTTAHPNNPAGSIRDYGGEWGGNLFAVGARNPRPLNGIGIGETLTLRFGLSGITFNELLDGLGDPLAFRIAQHVQRVGVTEDSVWTVNDPFVRTVPLPSGATAGLLGLGVVGAARASRRRRPACPA